MTGATGVRTSRSLLRPLGLVLAILVGGCAPPQLTASQEERVRGCLEQEFKEDLSPECAQQLTDPMRKAFVAKHPDFYPKLLADRKAFVEAQLAEDQRRRDELNLCVDAREAGDTDSSACEKFMPHEIKRAVEDRHLRRCAEAQFDGQADAQKHCEGFRDREIQGEIQMERSRRERNR